MSDGGFRARHRSLQWRCAFALSFVALLPSITFSQASPPKPTPDTVQIAIDAVLTTAFAPGAPGTTLDKSGQALVRYLYTRSEQRPLWFTDGRDDDRIGALIDELLQAPTQALRVEGYGLAKHCMLKVT